MVDRYLADLEGRLMPRVEDDLAQQWETFVAGNWPEELFIPQRCATAPPPAVEWPQVEVNQAWDDPEAMLLQQFGACSERIAREEGPRLGVRCNYGVGIIASLFGAQLRKLDNELNTLPTSLPLGSECARALLDRGVPDLHSGLGARVFEMAERFLAVFERYPTIGRYVELYHPDMQGPMDAVELLWGSELFTATFLEPDTVKALLELVTDTYIAFMHAWERLVPGPADGRVHWQLYHRGRIMLRDDSAMNFSPEHFDEFIRPYDQRLLNEFGGGAIHFCGRGSHYITSLSEMKGLYGVNLSQPELNDMETIFAATVDRGIVLLNLRRNAAEEALTAGRRLHGRVQCF